MTGANTKRYNLSLALLGLGDEELKRKGSQRGHLRAKNGSWSVAFFEWQRTIDGGLEYVRTEKSVGKLMDTSRRKAQAAADELVKAANAQAAVPQGRATLQQFVDVRFEPDHIRQLRPGGKLHYICQLNHILPTLGPIELASIAAPLVQSFLTSKLQTGLSSQSVRHIKNALSAILKHARNLGFLQGQLATEFVKIPKVAHEPRRALTFDQARMLLATLPLRYRPLAHFFLATGARASEAAGLRWRDVNLQEQPRIFGAEAQKAYTVHFRHAYKFGEYCELKTTKSRRDVPLTAGLWVELTQLRERTAFAGDNDPVFSGNTGTPQDMPNALKRVLQPTGASLGIPWICWHALRHTTATWLDLAGTPQGQSQILMGHSDSAMTARYTHGENESQREALEKATRKLN